MTRRQLLRLLAAAPALAVTGCTAQSASSQQEKPLILRYAENQPEDYPTSKAAKAFAELVAQRTGGRVKVLVYSGAELGAEQSVIQQMRFGGVDFSRVSLSQLAEYEPELSVLQLPYLYSDAQQMWRVLDGSIGDEFLAMLDGMDLVGLSWFDAGVRSFYTREKVTGLDDLQGLTIRVQESDMMSDMITALGAKPAQVVYSKVYAALHNAEIDGAENNWPSYEVMGHYEVAPFFLKDEHTRVPEVQLASPAVMEKLAALDESFPEVIRACARESAQTERELWARREANAEQNMRKRGICVTELDDAEKARFRAAVQPMYDAFSAQQELIDRISRKAERHPEKCPDGHFSGVVFAMNAGMYPTGRQCCTNKTESDCAMSKTILTFFRKIGHFSKALVSFRKFAKVCTVNERKLRHLCARRISQLFKEDDSYENDLSS